MTLIEKRFLHLAESDINSDCEFIVGPEETIIKGHKLIFSAASEVFQAMFYGKLSEDKSVKVDDLSAEGFEAMKIFIYTDEISFNSVLSALSTYTAAKKYLIPELSDVCTKFIREKIQSSNVLEFHDYCKTFSVTEFEEMCSKIIQGKTNEVVESEYFISAESDTIELILKLPSLKLKSEIEVFDLFERWALAEIERKQISASEIASSFNHLKKHIRFLTVDIDEFVSRVEKSVLLTHEEKHAIALNRIKLLSKPMPDSISLIHHPRDFNIPPSAFHQSSHIFVVKIDKTDTSSDTFTIKDKFRTSHKWMNFYPLSIVCDYAYEHILFRIVTNYFNLKAMFIIKSKFIVLAKNKCDDLVFVNDYRDLANNQGENIVLQKSIYLTMIPIIKLENERFLKLKNNQVVIEIEGTFEVECITL